MPQPQSCRSCEYLGRLVWRNPDLYRCGAPLPLFPDSVVVHGDVDDRRKMSPDDGQSCPTWEPAETEGLFSRPSDDAAFEVLKRDFGIGD